MSGIKPEWLTRKVSFEEEEAANMIEIRETGQVIPFGYCNRSWRLLVENRQPGDELWRYASDAESWENLAGSAGYALVRNGVIVVVIETLMN